MREVFEEGRARTGAGARAKGGTSKEGGPATWSTPIESERCGLQTGCVFFWKSPVRRWLRLIFLSFSPSIGPVFLVKLSMSPLVQRGPILVAMTLFFGLLCAVGCIEDPEQLDGADGGSVGERSADGLVALYTFEQGEGDHVVDRAEDEEFEALNLEIRHDGDRGDGVRWGEDCDCVHLNGGMLKNDDPAKLYHRLMDSEEGFSAEFWVNADTLYQDADGTPSRILTLSPDTENRNFVVGPSGSDLEVRLRVFDEESDSREERWIDETNEFVSTRLEQYVVNFDGHRMELYRNGQLAVDKDFDQPKSLDAWNDDYPMVLGDENNFDGRVWRGWMHLIAIYDRPLSDDEIERHFQLGKGAATDR